MARPRRWYCVFDMGLVVSVLEGADQARALLGGRRSYRAFETRIAAEEFAAWWNYQAYLPGGHLAHLPAPGRERFPGGSAAAL